MWNSLWTSLWTSRDAGAAPAVAGKGRRVDWRAQLEECGGSGGEVGDWGEASAGGGGSVADAMVSLLRTEEMGRDCSMRRYSEIA